MIMTTKIIISFIFLICSNDGKLNSLLARGKHYNEPEIDYIESKGYTWIRGEWVCPDKNKVHLTFIAEAPSLRK